VINAFGFAFKTGCDIQARTPSKQHENDPKFHLNAPLIKAEQTHREKSSKIKTSTCKAQGG
jgi:hypothetical protein